MLKNFYLLLKTFIKLKQYLWRYLDRDPKLFSNFYHFFFTFFKSRSRKWRAIVNGMPSDLPSWASVSPFFHLDPRESHEAQIPSFPSVPSTLSNGVTPMTMEGFSVPSIQSIHWSGYNDQRKERKIPSVLSVHWAHCSRSITRIWYVVNVGIQRRSWF